MYRQQAFVERCACNDPAIAGCAACGRARCGFHLTDGLCLRCAEAIRRELARRSGARFGIALAGGSLTVLALLALHSAAGLVLGIPVALAALRWLPRWQRRRLIARLGPTLAASRGELPAPADEPAWDRNEHDVASGYTPNSPV